MNYCGYCGKVISPQGYCLECKVFTVIIQWPELKPQPPFQNGTGWPLPGTITCEAQPPAMGG